MKLNTLKTATLEFLQKRPILSGVATLVIVISLIFALKGGATSASSEYYTVKRSDFLVSIIEGGTLEAVHETVVRNEVDGSSRVIYIVPEGSYVRKGDLIVELDSAEADDELTQQQITYEASLADAVAARNNLIIQKSTVDSAVRTAELAVLFAKMDLEKFEEVQKTQDLRNAEIEIITAEEALKLAEEKLNWTKVLTEKGFESKSVLDSDQLKVTNQKLTLEKAKSEHEMLEAYDLVKMHAQFKSDLEEAMKELDRVIKQGESTMASAQADVNSAEATLKLNEDKLAKMKEQLTASKIYAPQDGLIVYAEQQSRFSSESLIEEGATVRKRQELVKIPDTSQMKVTVKVHESHVAQVQEGQTAFVVLDSQPDVRYRGRVTKVGILPDTQSRWGNPNLKVYSTEIVIAEKLEGIKPGVSARAEIVITNLQDVLTVPLQAVTTVRGQQVCYVKKGGGHKPVPVQVGLYNNKSIEIQSGLEEGDQVLLSPPLETERNINRSIVDETEEGLPTERPELVDPASRHEPGGGDPGERGSRDRDRRGDDEGDDAGRENDRSGRGEGGGDRRAEMMKRFDTDGDGELNEEERSEMRKQFGGGRPGGGGGGRDRDGDRERGPETPPSN